MGASLYFFLGAYIVNIFFTDCNCLDYRHPEKFCLFKTSYFLHVCYKVNLSHTWHDQSFKQISERRNPPPLCRDLGVVDGIAL